MYQSSPLRNSGSVKVSQHHINEKNASHKLPMVFGFFSQASHVKEGGSAGLIPSQFLEEKRKAFVRRDWDNSGKI